MSSAHEQFAVFKNKKFPIRIFTLGKFEVYINDELVSNKTWGRDKTLQLLQFLIANRHHFGLHKEVIIDRIWDIDDIEQGNRDFKVALHGIRKVLEPKRKSRSDKSYITRQGATYKLESEDIWIDADAIDLFVKTGHQQLTTNIPLAIQTFTDAIDLYHGVFLPNRMYEDWSAAERERLQIQALNTYMTLSELVLNDNPRESIRLAQAALIIDNTWEEAYRIQMTAYLKVGNRPQAIKVFKACESILEEEYGIKPLPETKKVMDAILNV